MGLRWIKKITVGNLANAKAKDYRNQLRFEAKLATAVRAVRAENRYFPVIEATMKMKTPRTDGVTGEVVDEIIVLMELEDASRFASQMIHAVDAAMPRRPRAASRTMYGE